MVGATVLFCYFLLQPFNLRQGYDLTRFFAQYSSVFFALFTTLYVTSRWLVPHEGVEEYELSHLPLSETHWFACRVIDLCAVPLAVLLLLLPVYGIMLLLYAPPYGVSETTWVWRIGEEDSYPRFSQPYAIRIFWTHLTLAYSALMPAAVAVMLRETVRWPLLRIIVLFALEVGAYLSCHRIRYEYLELAYKKTSALSFPPFLMLAILLIALPILVGWLNKRVRAWLAAIATACVAVFAALPYLQYAFLGVNTTAWLRNTLGDMRYAMACFFGHLDPLENNRLLLDSYASALLFPDGFFPPHRISIWVGAGIYPIFFALWLIIGLGIGYRLRNKPQRHEG